MNNDIINIKGTRNGLVICLDAVQDFDEIKNTLKSKIESSGGFFKGAKFTFYLGNSSLSAEKTRELEQICCQNGLIVDHDINWPGPVEKTVTDNVRPLKREPAANIKPVLRESSPSIPAIGVSETDKRPCMLIQRGLRSGQKIRYEGNVVVFGDVNPGSEITASGDIVVMGSLRGLVHAGASGDQNAIIMAYRLNPVQLRIASTITRPPENNRPSEYPEIAKLQGSQMIIEPYMTYGLK